MVEQNQSLNGKTLLKGALAGILATIPMTLVMLALYKWLPWWEKSPLPPEQITKNTLKKTGEEKNVDRTQPEALTLAAHFGFGATAGAIYGAVSRLLSVSSLWGGIGYGLVVWTGSYLGWLPAAHIFPPAQKRPLRRDLLMIVAHLVFGSSLAWIFRQGNS